MESYDEGAPMPNNLSWKPVKTHEVDTQFMRVIEAVLDRFPNLPVSARKIMTMVYDPDTSAKDISGIAISDPVLVSSILKQVNSSLYSLGKKINNLNLAIILLGFNEVRNITIHCGMAKVMTGLDTGEMISTKDLWTHSYCVALSCEYWGKKRGIKDTGTLMTMGMLHDIGKFALFTIGMQAKRLGMKAMGAADMSPDVSLIEKEERLFRINHAIVGSILARKWNLSERIYKALEYHHYPYFFPFEDIPDQFREDVAVLTMSDFGVNFLMDTKGTPVIPSSECFRIVGISSVEDTMPPELRVKIELAQENLNKFGGFNPQVQHGRRN